jgi:hypothetical protein
MELDHSRKRGAEILELLKQGTREAEINCARDSGLPAR